MNPSPGVQTYPKHMVHPQERKSVSIKTGEGKNAQWNGTPDRFPPVTVMNPEQEGQHRALGYIVKGETPEPGKHQEYPMWLRHPTRAPILVEDDEEKAAKIAEGYEAPGRSDPEAFQKSAAAPYNPGHVIDEYPKMVDGRLVDPNAPTGQPIEYPKFLHGKIVNNPSEEKALLEQIEKSLEQSGAGVTVTPNVERGTIGVTQTPGSVQTETGNMREVPDRASSAKSKLVPEVSRRFYEAVQSDTRDVSGTETERQLSELRVRLFEEGASPEEAVRTVWGGKIPDAPPELRRAVERGLALSSVPSESAPTGKRGRKPLSEEAKARNRENLANARAARKRKAA